MKKSFWRIAEARGDFRFLSPKARRFFEESDQQGFEDLFGDCDSIEEIEAKAEEMYEEFFGEGAEDD